MVIQKNISQGFKWRNNKKWLFWLLHDSSLEEYQVQQYHIFFNAGKLKDHPINEKIYTLP